MKKLGRHNGFFYLVVLYLFATVVNCNMSVFTQDTLKQVQVHHSDHDYLPASFENALENVQLKSVVSESNSIPTSSFKNPFNNFSVHSKTAHSLLESKAMDYIRRVEVTLIQPQIFDILFPFHYYS